ncbi:MAG: GGDEF domain-containing protein [Steroidobacterales bacterium]
MKAAEIPVDETKRLQSLTSLHILDTHPEERFDRITRLACKVFNVPIALVTLVDAERQWFKSRQGFSLPETSRQIAICAHAILQDETFIVQDALLDIRFADNPLVTGEPRIRFYAGQPIHSPNGSRIGTLCVIDRKQRLFADEDKAMLTDLAAMIDREFYLLEQATTDELTHLSNRRGFTTLGAHVLALCRRNKQPAAVIGFDLDNFKTVNDRHGHDAGDHALRLFGKMLFTHFRASDVVARFGGDEFAVLCGGATAQQLTGTLGRLKSETATSMLARAYPNLSWSAGVADFRPESNETIEDLLRAADVLMYDAKVTNKRQTRQA